MSLLKALILILMILIILILVCVLLVSVLEQDILLGIVVVFAIACMGVGWEMIWEILKD